MISTHKNFLLETIYFTSSNGNVFFVAFASAMQSHRSPRPDSSAVEQLLDWKK